MLNLKFPKTNKKNKNKKQKTKKRKEFLCIVRDFNKLKSTPKKYKFNFKFQIIKIFLNLKK